MELKMSDQYKGSTFRLFGPIKRMNDTKQVCEEKTESVERKTEKLRIG